VGSYLLGAKDSVGTWCLCPGDGFIAEGSAHRPGMPPSTDLSPRPSSLNSSCPDRLYTESPTGLVACELTEVPLTVVDAFANGVACTEAAAHRFAVAATPSDSFEGLVSCRGPCKWTAHHLHSPRAEQSAGPR